MSCVQSTPAPPRNVYSDEKVETSNNTAFVHCALWLCVVLQGVTPAPPHAPAHRQATNTAEASRSALHGPIHIPCFMGQSQLLWVWLCVDSAAIVDATDQECAKPHTMSGRRVLSHTAGAWHLLGTRHRVHARARSQRRAKARSHNDATKPKQTETTDCCRCCC